MAVDIFTVLHVELHIEDIFDFSTLLLTFQQFLSSVKFTLSFLTYKTVFTRAEAYVGHFFEARDFEVNSCPCFSVRSFFIARVADWANDFSSGVEFHRSLS